jgi:RNA polymerase sigma factor (sigma-70 family)
MGTRPRNAAMMLDLAPISRPYVAGYFAAQQDFAPLQKPRAAQRQMRVQDKQAETDWTERMLAVRDRQDREAFAALFAHFAPRVKGFLMKAGSDAGTAEDCAQDVMATLWRKAGQFDPARASVATWVFTIARNRRIDIARRDRRPEPEDLDWSGGDEPDQAEIYEAAQETRRLVEALAELPEKQRLLVQRAFYGDLSHSEIAAETGLPLGTIKSRIRLALDRLRQKLT